MQNQLVMRSKKIKQLTKEQLEDLCWNKKLSLQRIAKIYGCGWETIRRRMIFWEIPLRNVSGEYGWSKLSKVTKEELVELYHKQGLSLAQIGKKYGVFGTMINIKMHNFGISLRGKRDTLPTYQCTYRKSWKGGRFTEKSGYVNIFVDKTNPYYSMAGKDGYIKEHRLVVAQHLGRPLLRSEIVHHKNGIRGDNRIENLELFPSSAKHNSLSNTCQNCELKKEIRLLQWQIKELTEALQNRLALGDNK